MPSFTLLRAVFARFWIEKLRYSFNTLSGLVALYLLFFVVFTGTRAYLPEAGGQPGAVQGIEVVFMLWSLAIFVFMEFTWVLTNEAQLGTLEQLAMSPFGLGNILFGRTLAGLSFHLLVMSVFLLLMMVSTGHWLHLDVVSLLPLVVLTIASIQGLGLAVGGLALVFKQVAALFQILQFGFAVLLAAPAEALPLLKYLPLAWGAHLVRRVMVEGVSIGDLAAADLGFLVAHAAAYLLVGSIVFKLFENGARRHGLLGHY